MFYSRTLFGYRGDTLTGVIRRPGEKNIIGKRVAEARSFHRPQLSQDALSGRLARLGLQLDRAGIAKIENNHRRVLDFELKALAEALRVQVDWLLGGKR